MESTHKIGPNAKTELTADRIHRDRGLISMAQYVTTVQFSNFTILRITIS